MLSSMSSEQPSRTDSSPRKRHRTENTENSQTHGANIPGSAVHDPVYYREDGDCVLLVKNTLFKIHKYLLARDSSAFEDMVALPKGDGDPPLVGVSDENPIVLHDSPADFRDFCWALYALPTQIDTSRSTTVGDVPRFVRIAFIANKYHFSSFEKWATLRVVNVCERLTLPAGGYLYSCSADTLAHIQSLAAVCRLISLSKTVKEAWFSRLKSRKLTVTYALSLGEKYGSRELQALAYYQQLIIMSSTPPLPGSTATALPQGPKLSLEHRQRILAGSWSLLQYQSSPDFLKFQALPVPDPSQCSAQLHRQCAASWEVAWQKALTSIRGEHFTDVLEKIALMKNMLKNLSLLVHFWGGSSSPTCKAAATSIISSMDVKLKDTLADHFFGSEPMA